MFFNHQIAIGKCQKKCVGYKYEIKVPASKLRTILTTYSDKLNYAKLGEALSGKLLTELNKQLSRPPSEVSTARTVPAESSSIRRAPYYKSIRTSAESIFGTEV